MFSNLATKAALKKVGLPSDALDFSSWTTPTSNSNKSSKKSSKPTPTYTPDDSSNTNANNTNAKKSWPAAPNLKWNINLPSVNLKTALPLTVHPWLTPPPPAVPLASEAPIPGDLAPIDRDRRLAGKFGGGRKVVVVFLRCVGCAFAQQSFLLLRALALRQSPGRNAPITFIAVSHSSAAATQKWIDMLGGTRGVVTVIVDEERAIYAAWGLGTGSAWYVLNWTSQVAAWKAPKEGWLGEKVAGSLKSGAASSSSYSSSSSAAARSGTSQGNSEVKTTMGNKWQQTGAWAIDGRGTVVWGGRAARADEVMDLEEGVKALGSS